MAQVALDTAADLEDLPQLDQKLWVALSCPTRGLEFDSRTLDLVDTDHDGHIRVPEILAAVKWICAVFNDPLEIVKSSDAVPLSSIKADTPEGQQLIATARRILKESGRPDATAITLSDTEIAASVFAQTKFNGDGIIPPESIDDADAKAVATEIIACLGGDADRGGLAGVTQAKVDLFFAALQAYSDWHKQAEENAAQILPLGGLTPAAYEMLKAVRAKVDDYFTRCKLAAFDGRAVAALNSTETDYLALANKELSATGVEAGGFPLSRIEPDRPLPLLEGVNPAWASALEKLYRDAIVKFIPTAGTSLTQADWCAVKDKFAPYEAWLGSKAGADVEKLGIDRVRAILTGNSKGTLSAIIAEDKSYEGEMNQIIGLERMVRYRRDLYRLLCNFVSFRDFYYRLRKATFQAGTLYLDGRSCELCVRVDDVGKHVELAAMSKTYICYCECKRNGGTEKMTIAAAFTNGDSDHLIVGRNGVFYDDKGQDWDATIVRIIDHPISIRQAIISPYKRIGTIIGDQMQKMAAARQKAAQDQAAARAAAGVSAAAGGGTMGVPQPQQPQGGGIGQTVGILAAIGLALGAIGTAVATIATRFLGLKWWQMPLSILGVFAAISASSVVLAWLKLRQRNLGPILDANGWAVNGRVKINVAFGAALTKIPRLPNGSVRMFNDPYARRSKKARRIFWTIFILFSLLVATFALLVDFGPPRWLSGKW